MKSTQDSDTTLSTSNIKRDDQVCNTIYNIIYTDTIPAMPPSLVYISSSSLFSWSLFTLYLFLSSSPSPFPSLPPSLFPLQEFISRISNLITRTANFHYFTLQHFELVNISLPQHSWNAVADSVSKMINLRVAYFKKCNLGKVSSTITPIIYNHNINNICGLYLISFVYFFFFHNFHPFFRINKNNYHITHLNRHYALYTLSYTLPFILLYYFYSTTLLFYYIFSLTLQRLSAHCQQYRSIMLLSPTVVYLSKLPLLLSDCSQHM